MVKDNHINTTLVIGNGFDLNLGMKTSYQAFFEEMESIHFFEEHAENPLIAYIYEKGSKECWYSFEDIIKEYALYSSQAQMLVYINKLLNDIGRIQHFDDNALARIEKYEDLYSAIPALHDLISICKKYQYSNLLLQNAIRTVCLKVRKEIDTFKEHVVEESVCAIRLLKVQLNKYIKEAHPNFEYSAASKMICSLLGCDDKGFLGWGDNISKKYNADKDQYFFPEFQIVSFNYTDALKLVTHVIEVRLGKAINLNSKSFPEFVYNIHGTLDGNLAFGTDEDNSIPKELWVLRKVSFLEENTKKKFNEILCKSKRVIIFGHSIHGIDLEYYFDFFKRNNSLVNVYILSNTEESLDTIKRGLEKKGVSVQAKYVLTNIYDEDFCKLCEEINTEQNSLKSQSN